MTSAFLFLMRKFFELLSGVESTMSGMEFDYF